MSLAGTVFAAALAAPRAPAVPPAREAGPPALANWWATKTHPFSSPMVCINVLEKLLDVLGLAGPHHALSIGAYDGPNSSICCLTG